MTKEKLVPKLRFDEFTDEEYWEKKMLNKVAFYRNGKAHENDIESEGNFIVVNSKFVSTNGQVKKYSNHQNEPLFKNEIVFVLSDVPNGRAIARTYLITKDNAYTLNQRIAGITPNENTNSYFLYNLMNRNPYFLGFDDGVKQTNLSKADVNNFYSFYPTKQEQDKIGSFFKQIDQMIQLQQSKVNKVKNIKSAYLSEMFPKEGEKYPKKRFEGFAKEWQFKELEELTSTFTDGDWIESKDQSDSGVRLIQTGNIGVTKFLDKPKNKKWISESTFVKLNCEEIFPGDILISRLPEPAGRATIVPKLNTRMITAVDCTIVRPSSKYSSDFLIQYLSTSNYFNEITAELAGGTRQRISRSNLAEIKVPVPETFEEQEKIGQFFRNLDNQIAVEEEKLDKLGKLKQAYLNDMFV